ncbi:MAG: hypothetical protein U9R15_08630 [Chloroflexota bacterium]|nr:hypothetical protein [Chloroflexota bacterium]
MMGANILIEKLVENGACDGVDKETCIHAIASILKDGEITVAKALLGRDFNTFKRNYRAAYEEAMSKPEPETEIDTRTWDEITADVVD